MNMCSHIYIYIYIYIYIVSVCNKFSVDSVSVLNRIYVTMDVTILLAIYVIFSMIIKQSLFNPKYHLIY